MNKPVEQYFPIVLTLFFINYGLVPQQCGKWYGHSLVQQGKCFPILCFSPARLPGPAVIKFIAMTYGHLLQPQYA